MAQPNQRMPERDRKQEGSRRDAASNALRVSNSSRDSRYQNEREPQARTIQLSRNYLNDLYERSSI